MNSHSKWACSRKSDRSRQVPASVQANGSLRLQTGGFACTKWTAGIGGDTRGREATTKEDRQQSATHVAKQRKSRIPATPARGLSDRNGRLRRPFKIACTTRSPNCHCDVHPEFAVRRGVQESLRRASRKSFTMHILISFTAIANRLSL